MSSTTNQKLTTYQSVSMERQNKIFKIIVIGDTGVGKSCLTFRFCSGSFPAKTEATIGVDFRERVVEVEGEKIKLQLWDTAGQERFRKSMVQHYYRNVHAVVFVYDVTKIVTFENLPHWINECYQHQLSASIPRILVGNKCDCKNQVAVKLNMAQKFADPYNMPVFETSAKDDNEADHVEAIFMTLAHKLKNSKPIMHPLPHEQDIGNSVSSRSSIICINKPSITCKSSEDSRSVNGEKSRCAC